MLILARHGQTAPNAEGRLLGRADPGLTELGKAQADAIALSLQGVSRVISSPLLRARSTAQCIGPDVEVDPRWIEIDYGQYEGSLLGDVPADVWSRWRGDVEYTLPGGESLLEVGRRVRDACEEIAADAAGRDVVIVSHVSPIKAAVAWALGVGDAISWRMFLDVAAITRVAVGPNGPSLRAYNDCTHLGEIRFPE